MAQSDSRIRLRNHQPRRVPRSYKRLPVDPSKRAEVTVVIRSKGPAGAWQQLVAASISGLPSQRRYLTRAAFGKAWGASRADLAAVSAWGKANGLRTVSSDAWRRCVVLSGTVERLQEAFGVEVYGVQHPLGTFRSYRGKPAVDASIHPIVEAVLGLDNLPSAAPHVVPQNPFAAPPRLDLPKLRTAYRFPRNARGKGQCIAIIELGGGIGKRDYNEYFKRIGIAPPPLRIRALPGTSNDPVPGTLVKRLIVDPSLTGKFPPPAMARQATRANWTWETAEDVMIAGTLAPEATLLLVLTTGDDQGQYHAVTSALADARNAPSVISCSWGGVESGQSPALMSALDSWFQAAAVLGVTICCSSGDNGDGTLGVTTGPLSFTTQFPASSPYVLACGGTTLDVATGTETAWNQAGPGGQDALAGGGGFSTVFERPPLQVRAGIDSADWIPRGATSGTGRGVPDVSAKANFEAAFSVLVSGVGVPAGGTSAATPVWAALIAVLNQKLRYPVGSINSLLYAKGLSRSLRDITQGNIGHLQAAAGWDPATGWGSPHGEAMLKALAGR